MGPIDGTAGGLSAEHGIIALYSELTHMDDVHGTYPPDDTSSDGLSSGISPLRKRWSWSYRHAFGLAYSEIAPDETGATSAAFLPEQHARFADHGVQIERGLTDNGGC